MVQSSAEEDVRLLEVLESIRNGKQKDKSYGVKTRKEAETCLVLQQDSGIELADFTREILTDKAYHKILEVMFTATLSEKKTYLSASKTTKVSSLNRLVACGDATRRVILAAGAKLKSRTIEAIVEHIIQTLPTVDGTFFEPLAPHYLKILSTIFRHTVYVEHLKVNIWQDLIDFCLLGINQFLDEHEGDTTGLNRSFSGLGSGSLTSSGQVLRGAGSMTRQNVEDLFQIVMFLVSASNSPLSITYEALAESTARFLVLSNSTISQVHQFAFSILNSIIVFARADQTSFSLTLSQKAIPAIIRFFQGRFLLKDEMLNSVRDEMLTMLIHVHLHLEKGVREDDSELLVMVENLSDVLIADYVKRDSRDQLNMDDLEMIDLGIGTVNSHPFCLQSFRLQAHNTKNERTWAQLQLIGILERLRRVGPGADPLDGNVENHSTADIPPRKRQRLERPVDRLLDPLLHSDAESKLGHLHVLPFVLNDQELEPEELSALLTHLHDVTNDKRAGIAGWALLAISSCARQRNAAKLGLDWVHLWQRGCRALTSNATCRAASVQLHSMLAQALVSFHEVGEDVNLMVTSTETHGPAILVDSSIHLMTHLLHVRVTEVPGASLIASRHVIHWLFRKWSPEDKYFVTYQSMHVSPLAFMTLLRICFGLQRQTVWEIVRPCGAMAQAWQHHLSTKKMLQYLLLLEGSERDIGLPSCTTCPATSNTSISAASTDNGHFRSVLLLVSELLPPKVQAVASNWKSSTTDRNTSISLDVFRSAVQCCLVALGLFEIFSRPLAQLQELSIEIEALSNEINFYVADTETRGDEDAFTTFAVLLQEVQPFIPIRTLHDTSWSPKDRTSLLRFLESVATECTRRSAFSTSQILDNKDDLMDVDEKHSTQMSQNAVDSNKSMFPRHELALSMDPLTFLYVVSGRLIILAEVTNDQAEGGMVPSSFIDHLLTLSDENIISSRSVILEVLNSSLTVSDGDATRLLTRLASLLSSRAFSRCEVAMSFCLDLLLTFGSRWSREDSVDEDSIGEVASQLYQYFIGTAVEKEVATPKVQEKIASVLLFLVRNEPEYNIGALPSPKASLFRILETSKVSVKFFLADCLPEVFGYFLLESHDQLFLDILETLPNNAEWLEGMSFRMFAMAKLASRWSNLLRRCIYHIFETPGKLPTATEHATRCLQMIAIALNLYGVIEILELFAPQLLYTWLDNEQISSLPYKVFGFLSLEKFVSHVREELTGLTSMRGEDDRILEIATILGIEKKELIRVSFTKVMAYSISQDARASRSNSIKTTVHESRVQVCLGADLFFQMLRQHFVEILTLMFGIMDQESDVEKHLKKSKDLTYAAGLLSKIKALGSSTVALPANQQPMFSSKTFPIQMQLLCSQTEYGLSNIYTPALVIYMCRNLLNTVHPALGSLHACSVLRKLRVLVCLAGETVTKGYALEMLLKSLRNFVADVDCADDAIGLIKYLLETGSDHLSKYPQFVAGIALSYLGTIRVFLQSNQSSTTQESQFKSTMSAAQHFREWFRTYLKNYQAPNLHPHLKSSFENLLRLAYEVETIGNAETGSSESSLLYQLLRDERKGGFLLQRSSRKAALDMLSSNFIQPTSFRKDLLGYDKISIVNAAVVWKSSFGPNVSKDYLSWAARVLGRAFAGSGEVYGDFIRESSLIDLEDIPTDLPSKGGSRARILKILEELTLEADNKVAGLSESALRFVLSNGDDVLTIAAQAKLSPILVAGSSWMPYLTPPSDERSTESIHSNHKDILSEVAITRKDWLKDLCIGLVQSVSDDYLLRALIPILEAVEGFAGRVFPFVLHVMLMSQTEDPQLSKKMLSKAFTGWLDVADIDLSNLRVLINAILYLRNQSSPSEKLSGESRSRLLDIDYFKASQAATRCGMYKTALMFVEEFASLPFKLSRRTSSVAELPTVPSKILLTIFENIDDPDMYYGVEQAATLNSVLARFEYEKDGTKSLAFRGAHYDSHLRRDDPGSKQDLLSLVKALDVLNQSGLSHSLLQGQQTSGMTVESLDSMFRTARKLEQWDIPVPPTHNSNAATIYKSFQMVHTATDRPKIIMALNEGLEKTMRNLVNDNLRGHALHESLQTLASLTEMDEIVSSEGSIEFEELLTRFQQRSDWMKTGRFDDITAILSTRGTVLSTLSRGSKLQEILNVPLLDTRIVELRAALLSSKLHRTHNALQESLSLATSMIDLLQPCRKLGIEASVAVHVEAANTLWEQGEMASSIRMLQALDDEQSIKRQTIVVNRANLLSQIGYQVSVARLERADRVVDNYLKPALQDLQGKTMGSEAGQVFHQFAVFCDQQLQDADNLEDLERLRKLKTDKGSEIKELERLLKAATSSADKQRYKNYHRKAVMWHKIDADEFQRQMASQDVFLHQCLENYLLALAASDDHNDNALRFTALWLEHSDDEPSNNAVLKHLSKVPSRKFALLMNQLTSRLQDSAVLFQKLLYELVKKICQDHPYHGVYQIYASSKSKPEGKDEAAVSRQRIAGHLSAELKSTSVGPIWLSVYDSNDRYCGLAAEKDEGYRSGKKYSVAQSRHATRLGKFISTHKIPPPTMTIPLAADLDYSKVPKMAKLDNTFAIASGVSAPKILSVYADNGQRYKQLVKGGNDDLRQDAIMEQVFEQVSELLRKNRSTRQRKLSIRTYKVLPLTSTAGVIEFVADTIPLHEFLMPAHERYFPKDLKPSQCRKEIADAQSKSIEQRVARFRSVADKFHPVMRFFFTENFPDPDEWFASRLAYTQSTAAISILGHVLGLGDRHGHNILLDHKSGEVVHIDLGVAFEMGRVLPVPELVPFRLTRDIIDGMGITKTEGVFRRCCEFTLEALRKEVYSIMTILDVLRYDPLYSWSISPVRLEKLQKEQSAAPQVEIGRPSERTSAVNEPGEADRALTVVNKKLSKTLSVTATVHDLINQASDERNLAVLYCGWAAYA